MSAQKPGLHPRNRHHSRYDLATLCQVNPELRQFLTLTPAGEQSVDFANPLAVKALNKALLAHFYAVANWDIPDGFLCPPVPGRADYIHHLADLLAEASGTIPANASILDIGVGANCIYPLIGVHEYGWRFTGSETSSQALSSAQAIISSNPGLNRAIRLRRQKESGAIFNGIIHKNEQYDATLCNPPFHDSAAAARAGSERKRRNLGLNKDDALNFGGQQQELWCEGGEVTFIKKMIEESKGFAKQVMWFTSLVSRGENLPPLYRALTPGRVAHEPSHQVKTALAMTQKAAIGKLAASLVQPGSCIYLDAGTTTLAIAQHLIHMESLTVVTNDFVIADYLLDNSNCTIIHTGGAVCRENRSCVGEAAATMLRSLMIDQAFISASSWSVRGISTPAEDKVTVKRAIASASRQRVLVCDATKYGQVATWLALPLSEFDQIITDDGLPESASRALVKQDLSLLVAKNE